MLADWRRMHRSQIQRLWCGLGLLQSNQCSYWSSEELESGPGVHSFLLLPGPQYWGSLKYRESWNTDLQCNPLLWSKVVAQQGSWTNWHSFPSGANMHQLPPTVSRVLYPTPCKSPPSRECPSLRVIRALLIKSECFPHKRDSRTFGVH